MDGQDWQEYTVDELKADRRNAIAMGPFGSRIKTDNFVEDGVPIIRGVNISQGRFYPRDFVFLTEEKADELKASNAFPGDLVFTHRGTLGQVGLIPEGLYPRYVVSQSQMKLSCDTSKVDPLFLFYYFSSTGKTELLSHVSGSGVPAIASPSTTLRNLKITIPPLLIQHKIADVLTAYDDLIEVNTRRIHKLEQMARDIYRDWFGKVDARSLPEGWEEVTIRDVSSYLNRGVSPKYNDNSVSIVINQKCIRNELLNLELVRHHSTKVPADKYIQFGDVLVNSTGIGTLGRIAQVYQVVSDCTVDGHVSIVRPNEKVSIDYFGLYLLTLQSLFDSLGAGSTGQTELSRERIAEAVFVLPPKSLQDKFSEIVSSMRKQIIVLTTKNANLRRTRDLLLPRLVSGEVDVSTLEIA